MILTILSNSMVRKGAVNDASKGAFVIIFGSESECGCGCCLQYFDHKILLLYVEHGFWIFFNTKKVLLTIFSHSKVRKGVVNDVSKGTFVIFDVAMYIA